MVNKNATEYVTQNIKKIISNKFKKNYKVSILFIGVAYKSDVDDIRESPALKILSTFRKSNYIINYHDPYVKMIKTSKFKNISGMKSIPLSISNIKKNNIIVIITNHKKINNKNLIKYGNLIIDSRHSITSKKMISNGKLIYV